ASSSWPWARRRRRPSCSSRPSRPIGRRAWSAGGRRRTSRWRRRRRARGVRAQGRAAPPRRRRGGSGASGPSVEVLGSGPDDPGSRAPLTEGSGVDRSHPRWAAFPPLVVAPLTTALYAAVVPESPLDAHVATPQDLKDRIAAERRGTPFLIYR